MSERYMIDDAGTLIDKETRDVYDYVSDVCPVLNDYGERVKSLEYENRLLKVTYAKCRDCKHANMYSPDFAFLVIDPKCKLGVKSINSESNACEDFELVGRLSR